MLSLHALTLGQVHWDRAPVGACKERVHSFHPCQLPFAFAFPCSEFRAGPMGLFPSQGMQMYGSKGGVDAGIVSTAIGL